MAVLKRILLLIWCMLGTCIVPIHVSYAQEQEDVVKATLIYNFFNYTKWPSVAKDQQKNLCILGKSVVTPQLESIQQKKQDFSIRMVAYDDSFAGCHMLYISPEYALKSGAIISKVSRAPVLTISDISGFSKNGGIVTIDIKKSGIDLQVNLKSMSRAGVEIRADALRLMKVIN